MSKRYATLYSDGSFSVCKEGLDLVSAPKWLGYEHSDETDKLVEVEVKITKIIHDKNPRFQIVEERSVTCPCCQTEVFIEDIQ